MRVLLDTHAFIWWVQDAASLSSRARTTIADTANECFFSVASAWEMAIKLSIAKLSIDGPLDRFLAEEFAANRVSMLPIKLAHVTRVADLPFHHRDPFDRLWSRRGWRRACPSSRPTRPSTGTG